MVHSSSPSSQYLHAMFGVNEWAVRHINWGSFYEYLSLVTIEMCLLIIFYQDCRRLSSLSETRNNSEQENVLDRY